MNPKTWNANIYNRCARRAGNTNVRVHAYMCLTLRSCRDAIELACAYTCFGLDLRKQTVEDEELQRGPILEALEPELKALNKAAADNWQALVKHCYSKHPPKISPPYQLDPDVKLTADNGKKTLKQAIIHYHPDKNVEQDVKWRVLCEEIVKLLNRCFECFKGWRHN